jgi:hypothetical protein
MNKLRMTRRQWRIAVAVLVATALVAIYSGGAHISGSVKAQSPADPSDVLLQNGAALKILPNPAWGREGDTVAVDVWLENITDIYGLDFEFTYESAKVSIPAGSATLLWEVFHPIRHNVLYNVAFLVDEMYDEYWYTVTNTDPALPFTGSGRLCTITFSCIARGLTPLHFIYVKASKRDGTQIPLNIVDGSIWCLDPTNVTLSQFSARPLGRSVRVLWTTEQESDLLGFNLFRAEDLESEPLRLNDAIIPGSAPGSPIGASYQFVDRSVEPDVWYYYWLEYVAVDGRVTRYGPQSAAVGQSWYPSIY